MVFPKWKDVWKQLQVPFIFGLVACVVLNQFRLKEDENRLEALEAKWSSLGRRLQEAGLSSTDETRTRWLENELAKTPAAEGLAESMTAHDRRLSLFTNVKTHESAEKNTGCVSVDTSTAERTIDLSTNACNGNQCPPCWIVTSSDASNKLKLFKCSAAKISNSAKIGPGQPAGYDFLSNVAYSITVINTDGTNAVDIEDGTDGTDGTTMTLAASKSVVGYCYTGSNSKIFWPAVGSSGGSSGGGGSLTVGSELELTAVTDNDHPASSIWMTAMKPPSAADGLSMLVGWKKSVDSMPKAVKLDITSISPMTEDGTQGSGTMGTGEMGGLIVWSNTRATWCGMKMDGNGMCLSLQLAPGITWSAAASYDLGVGAVSKFAGPVRFKFDGTDEKGHLMFAYSKDDKGYFQRLEVSQDGSTYTPGAGGPWDLLLNGYEKMSLNSYDFDDFKALACWVMSNELRCAQVYNAAEFKGEISIKSTTMISTISSAVISATKSVVCSGEKDAGDNKNIFCYGITWNGDTLTKGPSTTAVTSQEYVYPGAGIYASSSRYYSVFPVKQSSPNDGLDLALCDLDDTAIGCQLVGNTLNSLTGLTMNGVRLETIPEVFSAGAKKGAVCVVKTNDPPNNKVVCYGVEFTTSRRLNATLTLTKMNEHFLH